MAQIHHGTAVIDTAGDLPKVGTVAPDFLLVTNDLQEVSLKDYEGQRLVLNIFPSIDTSVCAASVREFNLRAVALDNVTILSIAKDLPFAMKRFCAAEDIDKVVTLSDFRDKGFTSSYGVEMVNGKLAGLMARAIVVIDQKGLIKYTELVPLIGQEPDYEAALNAI